MYSPVELSKAPESMVRALLLALCQDSRTLVKAQTYAAALQANAATNQTAGTKRKAVGEARVCVQCDDVFTPEENFKGACSYHPGELEVDEEGGFWDDHDERCHGPIDTEDNREACPEGFVWNCCDNDGYAAGCQNARHESDPNKSLKGSGVVLDTTSEEESDDGIGHDGENYYDNKG